MIGKRQESSQEAYFGIGELLEEWTHKKSVGDLARTMSLNIGKVWLVQDGTEVLVDAKKIAAGDEVVIHMATRFRLMAL